MAGDRHWRRKIESFHSAGLQYVSKARLTAAAMAPAASSEDVPAGASIKLPADRSEQIIEAMPIDATRAEAKSPPATTQDEAPMPAKEPAAPPKRIVSASPNVSLSPEEMSQALNVLKCDVAACARCQALVENRTQTVFSDGTPGAELCFVGEAPGYDEDQQGIPFVGKAGQLLTKIIEACKLKRHEVYICNVLKCRPPDNRSPQPDEMENCRPFFERQLEIVRPKLMVALGKYAAAALLRERPEKVPVTRMRGQYHEYNGIPFIITLHPAYLLRNPDAKKDVWEDMKSAMRRLGRPID